MNREWTWFCSHYSNVNHVLQNHHNSSDCHCCATWLTSGCLTASKVCINMQNDVASVQLQLYNWCLHHSLWYTYLFHAAYFRCVYICVHWCKVINYHLITECIPNIPINYSAHTYSFCVEFLSFFWRLHCCVYTQSYHGMHIVK